MKRALLIGLLALAVPARADEWTTTDTAFQAGVLTLQLVDWSQSRALVGQGVVEVNPLLGRHPSARRVNLTIGAAVIVHPLISYLLPQPWRRIWQVTTIVGEIGAVSGNAILGARFAMPW